MKRREFLTISLAAAGSAAAGRAHSAPLEAAEGPSAIELHLDLAVDPAKEKEMLDLFEASFRPAIAQQPGFIDAKMLKLRTALRGPAPLGTNYQCILIFTSEEMRQKWVATPTHKTLWPKIEATLSSPNYSRLLYEVYK